MRSRKEYGDRCGGRREIEGTGNREHK